MLAPALLHPLLAALQLGAAMVWLVRWCLPMLAALQRRGV
jgi:hypothetical protein